MSNELVLSGVHDERTQPETHKKPLPWLLLKYDSQVLVTVAKIFILYLEFNITLLVSRRLILELKRQSSGGSRIFPRRGRPSHRGPPTPDAAAFRKCLCAKMKELGPLGGGARWRCPLWIRQWSVVI